MSKILDRTGVGAALNAAQHDSNLDSLSGINESQTGTSYTVDIDDQNRTIELSNASAIAVTLTDIATIAGALHTSDFKFTIKNIGAGMVTITCGGSDVFDNGATTWKVPSGGYVTLQTDSTQAIWNRLGYDPHIILLDEPVLLLLDLSPSTSSTAVTHADLTTANAIAAKVQLECYIGATVAGGVHKALTFYAKSSAVTASDLYKKMKLDAAKEAGTSQSITYYDSTQFDINLDATQNFYYMTAETGTGFSAVQMHLVGYYV